MTSNTQGLVPPHSFEAEQSVLGGLMIIGYGNDDKFSLVTRVLKKSSFYHGIHGIIFEAMRSLASKNSPVDLITVSEYLIADGTIDDVGGFAYIAELSKDVPSAANITAYAMIVRDKAIERFTIKKLTECIETVYTSGASTGEKIDGINAMMAEVQEHRVTGKASGLRHIGETCREWLDMLTDQFNDPDKIKGYTTGITSLDDLLKPKFIRKKSLNVIGARPKMGKTAFLTKLVAQFALVHKKPVALFSLEMPSLEILERMVSQEARVDSGMFYMGKATDTDWNLVTKATGELKDSNLYLDDTPGITLQHIEAECRKLKREKGEIGMIGVDYLTLMEAGKADRNDLAYGAITKGLKNLSKQLDCPVFLLTQLNRALENRTDKRPVPSDSRDTGQIEQDCDLWLGLYREAVYDENADPFKTEIVARLNRHGGTGSAFAKLVKGTIQDCSDMDIANYQAQNMASGKATGTERF